MKQKGANPRVHRESRTEQQGGILVDRWSGGEYRHRREHRGPEEQGKGVRQIWTVGWSKLFWLRQEPIQQTGKVAEILSRMT
jgi:hypothetical protein